MRDPPPCPPCAARRRHIATGITLKVKRLTPEETSAMCDRLCAAKGEAGKLARPHVSASEGWAP